MEESKHTHLYYTLAIERSRRVWTELFPFTYVTYSLPKLYRIVDK